MKIGIMIIIGIVCMYFLFCGCELIVCSIINTIEMQREKRRIGHISQEIDIKYVIIIAALREQAVLSNTMNYFHKLMKQGVDAEVIISTTEREEIEMEKDLEYICQCINNQVDLIKHPDAVSALQRVLDNKQLNVFKELIASNANTDSLESFVRMNRKKSTYEIAQDIADELNQHSDRTVFHCVKTPADQLRRVGQINYAIKQWNEKQAKIAENVYIATYDADSAPDVNTFEIIQSLLQKRKKKNLPLPAVMQQSSCYFAHIGRLKGTIGAFAIADAIQQSKWSIGYEYSLFKRYSFASRHGSIRPLTHCNGHGCFIQNKVVQEIGGLPTHSKNDDLALGYLLSVLNKEMIGIPAMDFCEVAPNPFVSFKQSKFWFAGSKRFYKDIEYFIDKFAPEISKLQKGYFYIQGSLRNFFWACRANLLVLSTFCAVLLASRCLIYLNILCWLLYIIVPHFLTYIQVCCLNEISKLHWYQILYSCLLSPLTFVLRGIGPFMGLFTRKENNKSYKVERF